MPIRLVKMDGRHTGGNFFTHYAEFTMSLKRRAPMIGSGTLHVSRQDLTKEFVQCRNWCWEHFGPSCEVELYDDAVHSFAFMPEQSDPDWAWMQKNYGLRIYLKNQDIAGMFSLMWCK